MEKLRIIVGGFLGLLPAGGVTWDYLQYPLGLALMGHDVYYVEDTMLYPIYQKPGSDWNDASSCVEHLHQVMSQFGMKHRWAYRDEASGQVFGLTEKKLLDVCRSADVFINLSCSTVMRDEYAAIPVRILIDTDPMFTQIQYATQQTFTPGDAQLKALVDGHSHHFSFGENIGAIDCRVPQENINWLPTRQPICLSYWKPSPATAMPFSFTTLMNWSAGKLLVWDNEAWGQKDIEFQNYLSLPQNFQQHNFCVVMNCTGKVDNLFHTEMLDRHGWHILNSETMAGNWKSYQQFIERSSAEFSVAKHTYVKANTGWFSCRSACYLAAGRPVITQDTGWSKFIPSGEGVFSFSDLSSVKETISKLTSDYRRHCLAARELAVEYFDSYKVLRKLLETVSGKQYTKPKQQL